MSKIEWTEQTWNPVRGCSVVSPGCTNCYAMRTAHRMNGEGGAYEGLTRRSKGGPVWTGDVRCVSEMLDKPLRRRKPTMYFVNSMSDLFHEDVPDEFIAAVFGVMASCQQHTFQVLTKRPARAVEWFRWVDRMGRPRHECIVAGAGLVDHEALPPSGWPVWPLPNVWLGVSVEDQQRADERIPLLLQIPAVVRFLTCEPLLGPIDFGRCKAWDVFDSFLTGIGWVIVGGESGTGARPCHLAWVRSIVDQCRAAGVPCFVKQLGTGAYDLAGDSLNDDGTVPVGAYLDGLHPKAGDPSEWPEDLRVREYPT